MEGRTARPPHSGVIVHNMILSEIQSEDLQKRGKTQCALHCFGGRRSRTTGLSEPSSRQRRTMQWSGDCPHQTRCEPALPCNPNPNPLPRERRVRELEEHVKRLNTCLEQVVDEEVLKGEDFIQKLEEA